MGVGMKQVIGLWGKNYSEVAGFLGYKGSSTIEKRVRNNSWQHHEVIAILQKVEEETGIHIDINLVNKVK